VPIRARRRERVLHPAGRVVDQDVDRPELLLGGVEQARGHGRVGEVGLDRDRSATAGPDLGHHVIGVRGAVPPVRLGHGRIDRVAYPPERAQHRAATGSKRECGRRPDAVVGTGHDRDVAHRAAPQPIVSL
jgi:hypothetical protein